MKRTLTILLLITICSSLANAQGFGISMSYLYPKNGYFASPVAPLSFHDIGLDFGNYISLASSFTLYNVGGMSIAELPYGESKEPLMGPFVSFAIGAYPIITIPIVKKTLFLELKGGWLGFINFNPRLMEGNLNDYLANGSGLENVSSAFSFDNKFGQGWSYGGDIIYYFSKTMGIKMGAKYLLAQGPLNLKGTYSGIFPGNGNPVVEQAVDLSGAYLDYQGLSVNVGVVMKKK